jgi:predicted O-linked N-acetylglucosamine transferase (SPINDLY family)
MSSAPQTPELLTIALARHRSGALREAEVLYRQYLASYPNDAGALQLLGVLVHQLGRSDEALELLRRAIALNPNAPEYHVNLGAILAGRQEWDPAIAAFRAAIALRPDLPEARHNLGKALKERGELDQAIASFKEAVRLRNDHADAWHNLADALQERGRLPEAIQAYERGLLGKPQNPQLLNNLGNAHRAMRQFEKAVTSYRRALALKPDLPETLNNLAVTLQDLGAFDEAIEACRRSLELRPQFAEAYFNLANILRKADRLDEAVEAYRQAIALHPDFADAHANLGTALRDQGQIDQALACFRKAMSLTDQAWPASSFVFGVWFHPDWGPEKIREAHVQWNDRYARPLAPQSVSFDIDRSPGRRLRVGYVSPDFRRHSQSQFTIPLLSQHDHSQFEVFCYSNVAVPDEVTERIRSYADGWRDIAALSDEHVAEAIRRDRIDILVDLTMHMDRNRLLTFARKPAPVQVTWLAYPGTTGLTAIDYRLSDPHLDPVGTDAFYVEKTVRLPETFWCYDPLTSEPAVNALPALSTGYVTFGCLNNFAKVTDATIELWAKVLGRVGTSRLILLAPKGSARSGVLDAFSAHGIDPSRIEFVGRQPRAAYLATYRRIDLCLDTFPYNGHTTTLDSLWMGVPPITLAGATSVSRGGLSLLSNLQLRDFVAKDASDYADTAARVCQDLIGLAALRASLRDRMRASPLMDAPRFASNVEAAYRSTWAAWCA